VNDNEDHISQLRFVNRDSRERLTLKLLEFIIVSANRSVFVPREQCSVGRAFREFFFFPSFLTFLPISLFSIPVAARINSSQLEWLR